MKILVHDQEDFDLVIKSSKYLHNIMEIDTTNPFINTLCHLYRINSQDATEEEINARKNILVIDKNAPKITKK